jgi:adenylate kinase family enzyme
VRVAQAVAIIGPIASGKSTVSRGLSANLSWPIISFGAYVRDVARRQNVSINDRGRLERIGAELITNRGHKNFLRDVLSWHGHAEHIILDGIRHTELLHELDQSCERVYSFYLDTPDQLRYERWLHREGLANNTDSHAVFVNLAHDYVERHVFSLTREVDYIIDAARPPDLVIAEIRSYVG